MSNEISVRRTDEQKFWFWFAIVSCLAGALLLFLAWRHPTGTIFGKTMLGFMLFGGGLWLALMRTTKKPSLHFPPPENLCVGITIAEAPFFMPYGRGRTVSFHYLGPRGCRAQVRE